MERTTEPVLSGVVGRAGLVELFEGELSQRFQQPVVSTVPSGVSYNKTLVDQGIEKPEHIGRLDVLSRTDGLYSFEIEPGGEHPKPVEDAALVVVEKVVAPHNGGPEGLVPFHPTPLRTGQQSEAFVETVTYLIQSHRSDPRRRQFDGEGTPSSRSHKP